jgi:hypothetical protein
MKPILCIDPGASGGLALLNHESIIDAFPMPDGMTGQIDAIRHIAATNPGIMAVLEKVGFHRPGNSAVSTAKFARHCGHLEAALYSAGVPFEEVAPGVWMKSLGALPADKTARKNAIKEQVARRFPHLAVTLKTADALGMLVWAMQRSN